MQCYGRTRLHQEIWLKSTQTHATCVPRKNFQVHDFAPKRAVWTEYESDPNPKSQAMNILKTIRQVIEKSLRIPEEQVNYSFSIPQLVEINQIKAILIQLNSTQLFFVLNPCKKWSIKLQKSIMGSLEEENIGMEFQGLSGIYKEAINIITSWKLTFSQITLALILPLSLILLIYTKLFLFIVPKNLTFWLLSFVYFIILLTIFSLLSTSAVAYTISSIYTNGEVTFKKIIRLVPKVLTRLVLTFLCTFPTIYTFIFFYTMQALTLISSFLGCVDDFNIFSIFAFISLSVMLLLSLAGFGYLTIAWQLAGVVAVLEDVYGIKALIKSKELVQGKMGVAMVMHFELILGLLVVQFLFEMMIEDHKFGMWSKIGLGIIYFLVLLIMILFGLVVQTIFYFACKAYKDEHMNKLSLSDSFEVYSGDYVPLKNKDIQLEQYQDV